MPAEHPEGFAGSSSEFLDLVTHYTTVIRSKIDTEILVTMTIGIWNLESSKMDGWYIRFEPNVLIFINIDYKNVGNFSLNVVFW